jgi:hypothetical protein
MNTGARLPIGNYDNATKLLTRVAYQRIKELRMLRIAQVIEAMKNQLKSDADEVQTMNAELQELLPKFRRYNEVSELARLREKRVQRLASMLGNHMGTADLRKALQQADTEVDDETEYPLWQLILEIARQVPEIQAVELEETLDELGFDVSRQAIESAIRQHAEDFVVTKRGKEKFISLKGVGNASATNGTRK